MRTFKASEILNPAVCWSRLTVSRKVRGERAVQFRARGFSPSVIDSPLKPEAARVPQGLSCSRTADCCQAMSEVTRLLDALDRGEPRAAEELLPLVYEELRRLAHLKMAQEKPGQTLQPTALVHEAWLRLTQAQACTWANRRHFFGAAAEAMRRILVERARAKGRQRRGGGCQRVNIEEVDIAAESDDETVLLVDEALEKLNRVDPIAAELIRLRFFVGLPNDQAAELLGLSDRTARRNWAYARAWLATELEDLTADSSGGRSTTSSSPRAD
jgi:RNA polymerase sigma factor (TIGR02999 family)